MTHQWKTVKVFISSTFLDMQAERDYLVRFVFPRLREKLLRRKIHLVDVDLRWGVSSEQDALSVCKEIIDECRPRFVCILGGRYGWVPPGRSQSITDSEIRYSVFERQDVSEYRYFYFRDPKATAAIPEAAARAHGYREYPAAAEIEKIGRQKAEEQARQRTAKLEHLKQLVIDASFQPYVYPAEWDDDQQRLVGLEDFGNRLYADLLASIEHEFGLETLSEEDEFAVEAASIEAFIEERTENYVPGSRTRLIDELEAFTRNDGTPNIFLLTGEAGSGKSALLAKFVRDYRERHPEDQLLGHFIGVSPGSSDLRLMLKRLCAELPSSGGERIPTSNNIRELATEFGNRLKKTATEPKRVVLVVDALNQLDPAFHSSVGSLFALDLERNVRIIVSSLDHPVVNVFKWRSDQLVKKDLDPLSDEDAMAIITKYLAKYHKQMAPEQLQSLLQKADSGNPLYLLMALEELRTVGTYHEISDRIVELPGTVKALFTWVLERLEVDPGFLDLTGKRIGALLVRRFISAIAMSRYGLSLQDLVALIGSDPGGNIPALQRLLRPYLSYRGELIDFYHGLLRQAAIEVYLPEDQDKTEIHKMLAHHFQKNADPTSDQSWQGSETRPFSELPFHLAEAGDLDALSGLVETGFLAKKAARIGDIATLSDARMIAVALAEEGGRYREPLIMCAYVHCDLFERLGEDTLVIEKLAQAGDISQVIAIGKTRLRKSQSNLVYSAAAMLFYAYGHLDKACQLAGKIEEKHGLRQLLDFSQDYDYGICEIIRSSDKKRQEQMPDSPLEAEKVAKPDLQMKPRSRVPLHYLLAGHFIHEGFIVAWGIGAALLLLMIFFRWGLAAYLQDLLSAEHLVKFAGPDVLPAVIMIIVLVPGLAAVGLWYAVLHCREAGSVSFAAFERAGEQYAGRRKTEIFRRAINFFDLLGARSESASKPDPCLLTMASHVVGSSGSPNEKGRIILIFNGAQSDIYLPLMTRAMERLPKETINRTFNYIAANMQFVKDPGQIMELYTALGDKVDCAALLLAMGTVSDSGKACRLLVNNFSLQTGRALLATADRRLNARTIWQALKKKLPRLFILELLLAKRICCQPLSLVEPLLYSLAILPFCFCMGLFACFIVLMCVGFFGALVLFPIILTSCFSYFFDFYRIGQMGRQPVTAELLEKIHAKIKEPSPGAWRHWLQRRMIYKTILAEGIRLGDMDFVGRYAFCGSKALKKVIRKLVTNNLVSKPAKLIVAVMGNREILDITVNQLKSWQVRETAPEQPDAIHDRQLSRVLSSDSRANSLTIYLLIYLYSGIIWIYWSFLHAGGGVDQSSMLRSEMLAMVMFGLVFIFSIHIIRPEAESSGFFFVINRFVFAWLAVFIVLCFSDILSSKWSINLAVFSFIVVFFLAPTVIALWRGSHLLYPNEIELWLSRFAALVTLGVGCLALVVLSALIGKIAYPLVKTGMILLGFCSLFLISEDRDLIWEFVK